MGFALPANWYRVTAERICDELEPELGPLTRASAWRYLYATVAWFEERDGNRFLHLNDRLKSRAGQELAKRGEAFLAKSLSPYTTRPLTEIVDQIGRRYSAERRRQGLSESGWQRNNVTGSAMEATLQVLIRRLNGVTAARQPRLRSLRGFELAPVAYHSRPDLTLFSPRDFRLLISTKWTLRKERIGTYLHEAYFYRERRPDLQIAYVVAEFNVNILEWLVNDPLIDRVYHIHLPMLLDAHVPFAAGEKQVSVTRLTEPSQERKAFGRWIDLSERLFDLEQLFADIDNLGATAAQAAVDPEADAPADDGDDD